MHPAYSVIFFTTASGAGYGLWFWLGLRLLAGGAADGAALAALIVGGVLVTFGLFSSTFHLGHPERAWRALSQWRSSWLSREGVAAVATYVPAGLLFLGLVLPGGLPGVAVLGLLLALGASMTVWCTGMIYAALRTVPEWNHGIVPVLYLGLAGGTGALVLAFVDAVAGVDGVMGVVAGLVLPAAAALKWVYWRRIDGAEAPFGMAEALGIPGAANIRVLDPPHTRPNFVMREMGYAVARRHAVKLRLWALTLLLTVPIAGLILAALLPGLAIAFLALAVAAAGVGVWVERWLFFAEARHLSMLYYGATPGGRGGEVS
ncbi:dimethyl sulfoxide reductase anchor subunit [Roseibacterium sp. SDUM158016]|uniref:dimethyl sulfoxide reductase anchor subunit family protein n=1 Tax=Roseicyclus sediminis TaxID=2980997 RepID=UPI0021D37283|nr:DmsC/YnfH family molybdoenzyme membrane anchor subunit [Roseibacterium sp. SDUM158016]MCU4653060.1 dimethyl sulfoxide reductase anchor subunit [Roseibacterium sp. SDUM158016]